MSIAVENDLLVESPLEPEQTGGTQAAAGAAAWWACLPALELLWLCPPQHTELAHRQDLHFLGTGDARRLPLRGPLGL